MPLLSTVKRAARYGADLAVVLQCWVGVQIFDTEEEKKPLKNPQYGPVEEGTPP